MNYEQAKQLKNAGFPLESHIEQDNFAPTGWFVEGSTRYRFPILEELIEACGRRDFKLRRTYSAHEDAIFFVIEIPGDHDMERCATPTEAVAKLWLALNKKV